MGNNAAYSTFQHTIVTLYNHGVLTLPLLDELAREYAGTDIDSGGDTGLTTHDDKTLEDVCIGLIDPGWTLPEPTSEDLVPFDGEREGWASKSRYDKWCSCTNERWGWH